MAFLTNGFSTTVTFGSMSTSGVGDFEVIELTPFSISMGGKIETTTMSSSTRRRFKPKSLYTIGPMKLTVAFETTFLTALLANAGVEQAVTINFPDATNWPCNGWIEEASFSTLKEGERPTCEITVEFGGGTAPSWTA
jgi:hypothetical protein